MDTMLRDFSDKGRIILKPLKWIALFSGCNILYSTTFIHPMKLLNLFLLVTSSMGCMAQWYYFWIHRHLSFDAYIEAILIFFQCLISIWKLWVFTFSQQSIFDLIQSVQNLEILENLEIFELELKEKQKIINDIHQILKDSWSNIKVQLTVHRSSVFGICSWYLGHSLLSNIYNLYYKPEEEIELEYPFPAAFPVWHQGGNHLTFFVQYLIITMEIYLATVSAITCSGLFSVISVHCATLLKVLRLLIGYTTTDQIPPRERVKYIWSCIRLHQRILNFCYQFNNLYRTPALGLFVVCGLVICILTFKASLDMGNDMYSIIKALLYFTAVFYELAIYCVNGQRITAESDLLPMAIYDVEWFNENEDFRTMIHIMIQRSNHSVVLGVGGFAIMSMVTLCSIMRSSVSYFLFLRKCM